LLAGEVAFGFGKVNDDVVVESDERNSIDLRICRN
jgi:hypothetical protein